MCKIENQAVLFALLSKYTNKLCPELGKEIIQEGMIHYGNQRGKRMAENAISNGDPLTLWANLAYGEWNPDYPEQMEFGNIQTKPVLKTYISKCAWCEAWEKYDLIEDGKYYCVNVDNAVFQGFNPEFLCTPLTESMSFGGSRCEFDWGKSLSEEDQIKLNDKKKEIGNKFKKDFDFHTAHIYYAITDVLKNKLPEKADEIIKKASDDYIELFGKEAYDVIFTFSKKQF